MSWGFYSIRYIQRKQANMGRIVSTSQRKKSAKRHGAANARAGREKEAEERNKLLPKEGVGMVPIEELEIADPASTEFPKEQVAGPELDEQNSEPMQEDDPPVGGMTPVVDLEDEEEEDDDRPLSTKKRSRVNPPADKGKAISGSNRSSTIPTSYPELVQARVDKLSDVPLLTGVDSLYREYPELEFGKAVVRRAADQDLVSKLTNKGLTADVFKARSGLVHSEALAMVELATSYWKASEEQEKLAKTMLDRKSNELGKLEDKHAKLREEHSDLDAAYEVQKLVKENAVKAKDEAVEKLGEVEKELAAAKAELETTKKVLQFLTKLQEDHASARATWKEEADAHAKAAVEAYKDIDECYNNIQSHAFTFYDVGRRHMARRILVDPSFDISLEQLAMWASQEQYDMQARLGHPQVPYSDNDLAAIAEEDIELEAEPWVAPPVDQVNFNTMLHDFENPEELAFEGDTPRHGYTDSGKLVDPQQQEKDVGDQATTSAQVETDPAV